MSKKRAVLNPVFFNNLNHSLSEWLTNRINRATFAATSFMTVLLATTQGSVISTEELNETIGGALRADTIYVLQIDKDIAALIIGEESALLARFTPASGEASFEVLAIKNYGEERTNEILDSMIIKRTFNSYYHVEAEEFAVINEMISGSMNSNADSSSNEDDDDDSDDEYDDDDDEDQDDYEDEDDDDDEPGYTPRQYMDDDGRYYDEELWYETHFNPPGTIDCGDGYLDDDGVFTEY